MKKISVLLVMTLCFLMLSGCSLSCEPDESTTDTVLVKNGDNNTDSGENEQAKDTDENKVPDIPTDLIKDPKLNNALREQLEKTEGQITKKDLESLLEVDLANRGIIDITGLEYAVNLKVINLRGNNIRNISPLENLRELEILILDRNEIIDISPVSGLMRLKALELKENRVKDISNLNRDNLPALRFLDLRYNFLDMKDPEVIEQIDALYESGVDVMHDPLEQHW